MSQLTDEQLQNTNSVIANGLEAKKMRHKIENKDLLSQKGALYVGTGNTTSTGACVTTAFTIPADSNGKALVANNDSDTGWSLSDHISNADNIKVNDAYTTLKLALLDVVYPIGSIYLSVNNLSPQTFLGGTWEEWGAGRVPVGVDSSSSYFNAIEKTGGELTHKLTINEMPSHNHQGTYTADHSYSSGNSGLATIGYEGTRTSSVNYTTSGSISETNVYRSGAQRVVPYVETVTAEYGVPPQGGGAAHNNLQPYITCYMWKRTA